MNRLRKKSIPPPSPKGAFDFETYGIAKVMP